MACRCRRPAAAPRTYWRVMDTPASWVCCCRSHRGRSAPHVCAHGRCTHRLASRHTCRPGNASASVATLKAETCAMDQSGAGSRADCPALLMALTSRCPECRTGQAGLLTGACRRRRRGWRPCASAPLGCRSPPCCAWTAHAALPATPARARPAPHRSPAAAGLPSKNPVRQPPSSVRKRAKYWLCTGHREAPAEPGAC